jgi:hypothetical protein
MKVLRVQAVEDYWLAHYVDERLFLCTLCGNTGEIDTTATAISPAGVPAGRVNYCICPNGQTLRVIREQEGS